MGWLPRRDAASISSARRDVEWGWRGPLTVIASGALGAAKQAWGCSGWGEGLIVRLVPLGLFGLGGEFAHDETARRHSGARWRSGCTRPLAARGAGAAASAAGGRVRTRRVGRCRSGGYRRGPPR